MEPCKSIAVPKTSCIKTFSKLSGESQFLGISKPVSEALYPASKLRISINMCIGITCKRSQGRVSLNLCPKVRNRESIGVIPGDGITHQELRVSSLKS